MSASLLDRYTIDRGGRVYTVEIMQHDKPLASCRNFYAWVSDDAERVIRTRDNKTADLSRLAAVRLVGNWEARQTPRDYSKRKPVVAKIPRQKMLDILRATPGLGLADLSRAIGRLDGTVAHWLTKLRADGTLRYEETTNGKLRSKRWYIAEAAK